MRGMGGGGCNRGEEEEEEEKGRGEGGGGGSKAGEGERGCLNVSVGVPLNCDAKCNNFAMILKTIGQGRRYGGSSRLRVSASRVISHASNATD